VNRRRPEEGEGSGEDDIDGTTPPISRLAIEPQTEKNGQEAI
jgi:hypothetical protein